jgi:hypothetical protein
MLEMVKVPLPTFVNIAVCAALVVPISWVPKLSSVELIEKPAVEAGVGVTGPPPPPQEANKRAKAMQTPTIIAVLARRR